MGNLVVFRREADPDPLDNAEDHYSAAAASKELPETLAADCPPDILGKKSASWTLPVAFKRFGLTHFARGRVPTGVNADPDGYLLVLLADQELTAGRDTQALTLLDAAFAAFDRRAHGQPYRMAQQR
jgi:hypothetical protein